MTKITFRKGPTLEEIKERNIQKARAYYQSRPFATKVYLALQLKMPVSFINENWAAITSAV